MAEEYGAHYRHEAENCLAAKPSVSAKSGGPGFLLVAKVVQEQFRGCDKASAHGAQFLRALAFSLSTR